ncbi:MAG: retroviral-like aspartic protease family protein [Sulfuritalea sp.]|nr:retroviral-like aspartic protease family protein [Sulfuritalea sp.]
MYGARATTANGSVTRCTARGMALQFGQFQLNGVDVDILENLEGDALLGMNVLRLFSMQHSQGVLRITPG